MLTSAALLSTLLSIPLTRAAGGSTVNVPSSPPQGSFTVDPSFPNFAFELASLFNFVQSESSRPIDSMTERNGGLASDTDSTPNQYSLNLLNEVYKRTGGHPVVRVGGTSGSVSTSKLVRVFRR